MDAGFSHENHEKIQKTQAKGKREAPGRESRKWFFKKYAQQKKTWQQKKNSDGDTKDEGDDEGGHSEELCCVIRSRTVTYSREIVCQ